MRMRQVRFLFTLRHPDFTGYQLESCYNPRLQALLGALYSCVTEPDPDDDKRLGAEAILLKQLSAPKSKRQAMLLYYLLARCGQARDLSITAHAETTQEWCSRALEIAQGLQDAGALVDLYALRGTIHRATSLYAEAANDFSMALCVLREYAEDGTSLDPDFEANLAAKAATLDYMAGDLVGNFSRAIRHLRWANDLLPLTSKSALSKGTVAWTFALIYRQRNELEIALHSAETAAAYYCQEETTCSTCRILSLTADIVLDMAESCVGIVEEAEQRRLFREARNYIAMAHDVGERAQDREGIQLANLVAARLKLLQSRAHAAEADASIRRVLRWARYHRDLSLLASAQTALGVHLYLCGKRQTARRWLEKAIASAANIKAPGLAYRAQRYLRLAEGRNA